MPFDLWLPPRPAIIRPEPAGLRHKLPLVIANFLPGWFPIAVGELGFTPEPFSLTNTDNTGANVGGASSGSFANRAIGATVVAGNTRYIIAAFGGCQNANRTVNSCTIGGVAGSFVVGATTNQSPSAIFIAAVPTGTTATIAWVASGSVGTMGVSLFRLINPGSSTAFDTAAALHSKGTVTLTLDIPTGGSAVAVASYRDGSTSTWNNIAEVTDVDYSSNDYTTAALGGTPGTNVAVNCDCAQNLPSSGAGCSASWGP